MKDLNIRAGQESFGFLLEEVVPVKTLNMTAYRLRHGTTGARMLHLACDDENNLFAVGFRTPPKDSTGVAHILEHTVLCGSRNFPVRDPFFSMLKRSLNTFMNALTASDWTLYPFSSMNRKDFENLMRVYLDAAFFPLLRERDFNQEGHRLDFADPTSPGSPLVYKGVVYNEMKGAMADPSSLISRRLCRHLYPETTYGLNSGGEPSDIPSLTWEELRSFHATHYHPSNAYIFTCGNFPLEGHLEMLSREVLSRFERIEPGTAVPPEPHFAEPKHCTESYPVDPSQPLDGRSMVQVGWLACDIDDSFDRLALKALASLLLGNAAAPLYKALLDSKLGSNLAPGAGYHDDNRTTLFAAGLQGTDPEKAGAIEALILSTLEDVARTGFSPERVDAVLHRMEFGAREVTGDSYPYPLILLMRMMGPWIHGGDPLSALDFDADLARLKREAGSGPFFGDLIRRYLIDNPHRVTLTLRPDPEQAGREEAALAQALEAIRAGLSATEVDAIKRRSAELQTAQEAPEDLSCLPTLQLSDVDRRERPVHSETSEEGGRTLYWFDQPTNGIGYFTAYLDLGSLPADLYPHVPLFCSLLSHIGAAGSSYLKMAERIEEGTGGVYFRPIILESPAALDAPAFGIQVKGKALARNFDKMFGILSDLFIAPDFTDLERLRTVIHQIKTSLENSIPSSGHTYAARRGGATLTYGGQIRELWNGLEHIRYVRAAASLDDTGLAELAEQFKAMARILLGRNRVCASFTGEKTLFPSAAEGIRSFLSAIPEGEGGGAPSPPSFAPRGGLSGYGWSVPVSYVTRTVRTVPYTHPDTATLMVLSKLMRAEYLHREIREKGGAYGGIASCDGEGGLFSLLSYRDPHLLRTLKVYDDAVTWACEGAFGAEAIKEAILGVFSAIDRPLSPGGKGQQEFFNILQGLTYDLRNELRERILSVDADSLAAAARRYLAGPSTISSVAVISGEKTLEEARSEMPDLSVEPI